MTKPDVGFLWDTYMHRLLAEGVHYRDILDMRKRITKFDEWCQVWSQWARTAEERADQALTTGFTETAGLELARASLYYFFAQFVLWRHPSAKHLAYQHCVRTFKSASEYLDPPQRPVQIPYGSITIPGYLRLPAESHRPPCVILIGGLDTTKEEQLVISNLCVQRGLATLSFDGPGQGETYYEMKLNPEYHQAVAAVLDFAQESPEVDGDRLGVIGRSLGGHYAPRIAALDKRVKAAVAWGAMYHLRNYRSLPPLTQTGFLDVTGSKSLEEARPYFESVDLDGIASNITCPLMIVHGGLDNITPTENATLMQEQVSGPTELLFWEDSYHCVHDRSHICRPGMADFMHKHLAA